MTKARIEAKLPVNHSLVGHAVVVGVSTRVPFLESTFRTATTARTIGCQSPAEVILPRVAVMRNDRENKRQKYFKTPYTKGRASHLQAH